MTIIVLYILLGIIAFIVILLHFSVRAEIKASKQGVDIKVKWLFFTFYPRKPKKPKKDKNQPPPESDDQPALSEEAFEEFIKEAEKTRDDVNVEVNTEKKDDTTVTEETVSTEAETVKTKKEKHKKEHETVTEEKTEKKGKIAQLKDKFNTVKPYIPMGWKYFRKILKKIRITNIDADVTVGKEDACEAAIWYGKVQGIIFSLVGWLSCVFTVKMKRVDVHCKFNEKVMDGEISLKVKVRPSTMIHIAFCVGIKALCIFLGQRRERKRKIKAARKRREQLRKQKTHKANAV